MQMIIEQLLSLFISIIIYIILITIGDRLLSILKFDDIDEKERIIYSLAIGLMLLSIFMFSFGFLHIYKKLYFQCGLILLFLIFIRRIPTIIKKLVNFFKIFASEWLNLCENKFDKILLLLLLILIFLQFIYGLTPTSDYDTLLYRYSIPKEYIKRSGIENIDVDYFHNVPQFSMMWYLLGMLIYNDIVSNLMSTNLIFFLYPAIYLLALKFTKPKVALYAVFIFAFTHAADRVLTDNAIESHIAFYFLLVFIALFNYILSSKNKYLFIASAFAGFSAGIKQQGFILIIIFCTIVSYILIFYNKEKLIVISKLIIFIIFLILIFGSPPYIKTWIYKGHPLWPYFGHNSDYASPFISLITLTRIWYFTASFISDKFQPVPLNTTLYGPIILILFPFTFFYINRNLFYKIILIISLSSFILTALLGNYDTRYWIPFYSIFSIILSVTFFRINSNFKTVSYLLLLLLLFSSFLTISYRAVISTRNIMFTSRESIYSHLYPTEYRLSKFVNKKLEKDSKLLYIGNQRPTYFFELFIKYIYFIYFPYNKEYLSENSSIELLNKFCSNKFNYLLYDKNTILSKDKSLKQFIDVIKKVNTQILELENKKYLVKIFDNGIVVYKIKCK